MAFERFGKPFPRANAEIRDVTERVLRGSGVVLPRETAEGEVRVIVNNTGDLGEAFAKGFGTGLTLGLAGSTINDFYEMTLTITMQGRIVSRSGIKGGISTAIGATSLPPGVEGSNATIAVAKVLETMILTALADMQRAGELPSLGRPGA